MSFVNTQISEAIFIAFFAISSALLSVSIKTFPAAAGKVLMETDKSAEEIAKKAIKIASEICVFTNDNVKVLKI